MSQTDTAPQAADAEHDEHHGPTTRQYVQIFAVLFILTAMEVAASFIDVGPVFLPLLIGLMVLKFALVVGWFMHLRFDTKLYSRLMYTGLGAALVLYTVVLLVFSDAVFA